MLRSRWRSCSPKTAAPPSSLWAEPLIASRLLEYEIWTRLNVLRIRRPHGDEARTLIQRVALVLRSFIFAGFGRQCRSSPCKLFWRRAAIEPVIGHRKAEHRMGRDYLAHRTGDAISVVLAAAGYNFHLLLKWLELLLLTILAAPKAADAPHRR